MTSTKKKKKSFISIFLQCCLSLSQRTSLHWAAEDVEPQINSRPLAALFPSPGGCHMGCSPISVCSVDLPGASMALGDCARALSTGLQTAMPGQANHPSLKARFCSLPHVHTKSLVNALNSRNTEKKTVKRIYCYCLLGSHQCYSEKATITG